MVVPLQINKKLLPMKGHYFLFNAGTGPVIPFMSVYAKQLGFSSVTVGIIYTVLPVAGIFAKTIMGGIADRYQCKKAIFLTAILLTGLSFLLLNFTSGVPTQQKMRFACEYGYSVMDTCANNFTIKDDCAVEKVTSTTGSPTVYCQVSCDMTNKIRETVCNSWNVSEYCGSSVNTLSFTAAIAMKHTEKIEDCIIFQINRTEFSGKPVYPFCPEGQQIQSVCDVNCDLYSVNDLVRVPTIKDNEIYSSSSFWILLCFFLLSWICQAVVVSIGDAICFELLGNEPNKYGYQRLWGSLGWGVSSVLAGYLIDFYSGEGFKNYTPAFIAGIVIMAVNFVNSYFIKYQQLYKSPSILRDVGSILKNLRVIVFFIWCMFLGMCTGLLWNFLFWYVEDLANAQGCDSHKWIKTLQGLIMGTECILGELPFFFLSGWILKRIGHINSMSLILLALAVRFTLYSFIPNPWWFLPIEVMNGLTFGLGYATMASYASIAAPPGTEATVQGIMGAMFEGVGVSLGSFVGGVLFFDYGGAITFRIMGIMSFVMCLLHAGVEYWLEKRHVRGKDITITRYAAPQDAIQMVDNNQDGIR